MRLQLSYLFPLLIFIQGCFGQPPATDKLFVKNSADLCYQPVQGSPKCLSLDNTLILQPDVPHAQLYQFSNGQQLHRHLSSGFIQPGTVFSQTQFTLAGTTWIQSDDQASHNLDSRYPLLFRRGSQGRLESKVLFGYRASINDGVMMLTPTGEGTPVTCPEALCDYYYEPSGGVLTVILDDKSHDDGLSRLVRNLAWKTMSQIAEAEAQMERSFDPQPMPASVKSVLTETHWEPVFETESARQVLYTEGLLILIHDTQPVLIQANGTPLKVRKEGYSVQVMAPQVDRERLIIETEPGPEMGRN